MTTSANHSPRSLFGTLITRPLAATVPLGTFYTDTTNTVYECMPVAGVHTWVQITGAGAGIVGGLPYLVGPLLTGAPYQSVAVAVAAAAAAGASSVYVLAGAYPEPNFTLPLNMEIKGLAADPSEIVITCSLITLDAASGLNTLSGFFLRGALLCLCPTGASTANLVMNDVYITAAGGIPIAFGVDNATTGLNIEANRCQFDGDVVGKGMDITATCRMTATDCAFKSDNTHTSASVSGGTFTFNQCTFQGFRPQTGAATTITYVSCQFLLSGVGTDLVSVVAGSTLRFHLSLYYSGLDAAGRICDPTSDISGSGGVHFGSLQVLSLPALSSGDGSMVFVTNAAGVAPDDKIQAFFGATAWRRFSNNAVVV